MKFSHIRAPWFWIFAGLLLFSSFSVPSIAQVPDEVVISMVPYTNRFNVTEVNLEKNTPYIITFVNPDPAYHNLWIDVDGDVSATSADTADPDDILVGEPNNSMASLGGDGKIWSVNWTTPNMDVNITYYCGTTGHFSDGNVGTFIIGQQNNGTETTTTKDNITSGENSNPSLLDIPLLSMVVFTVAMLVVFKKYSQIKPNL